LNCSRRAGASDAKNHSYATTVEGVLSRPFSPRNSSSAAYLRVNGKIRAREVRVIMGEKQLGVFALNDALKMARDHGVDLVEISATANPPVCKIVEIGKFRYEQAKREKESKKHQHASIVKEIQLSPRIDPHDLGIKVVHAVEFLCEDMKVKAALKFRGREMAHTEVGFQVVNKFLAEIAPYGHPDFPPKLIGKGINVMISPLPRNKRGKNPHPTENESALEKNHHESNSAPKSLKEKIPVASESKSANLNSPFANLEVK
jgi:translation initiation factor IF-3